MSTGKRLDLEDYISQQWRMAELASDFELVDAWSVPARGSLADFKDLHGIVENPAAGSSAKQSTAQRAIARLSGVLFTIRDALGAFFGWDNNMNTLPIPGCRETTLRDRLTPAEEERLAEAGNAETISTEPSSSQGLPFQPVLVSDTEFGVELSNAMVHAVMHLGWVKTPTGHYEGMLGVYVKYRNRLGRYYMTAIGPFRHYIVYPAMMKRVEASWAARGSDSRTTQGEAISGEDLNKRAGS